jgi:hypothetical protein
MKEGSNGRKKYRNKTKKPETGTNILHWRITLGH